MNIYCLYDSVRESYTWPLVCQDDNDVCRLFLKTVEPGSLIWNESDAFTLLQIGSIDGTTCSDVDNRVVMSMTALLQPKFDFYKSMEKGDTEECLENPLSVCDNSHLPVTDSE